MFKVGDKAIFNKKAVRRSDMLTPEDGEIVVISQLYTTCSCGCGLPQYRLSGYEYYNGFTQSFAQDALIPLQSFGEEVAERIESEFEVETPLTV